MLLVLLQQLLVVTAPVLGDELRSLPSLRPKLVEPRRHHLREKQSMTSPPPIKSHRIRNNRQPPIPGNPNLQPIELSAMTKKFKWIQIAERIWERSTFGSFEPTRKPTIDRKRGEIPGRDGESERSLGERPLNLTRFHRLLIGPAQEFATWAFDSPIKLIYKQLHYCKYDEQLRPAMAESIHCSSVTDGIQCSMPFHGELLARS